MTMTMTMTMMMRMVTCHRPRHWSQARSDIVQHDSFMRRRTKGADGGHN
jgi:hypothetical protein